MKSILIAKAKTKLNNEIYALPWKYDSSCFNFHEPDILIPDTEIDIITDQEDICTLAVKADLKDYSFIAGMKNLSQLYLYKARHLKDLSFLENLIRLDQICIVHSKVTSLECLDRLLVNKRKKYEETGASTGMSGIYIHSELPEIAEIPVDKHKMHVAEIIINGKRRI